MARVEMPEEPEPETFCIPSIQSIPVREVRLRTTIKANPAIHRWAFIPNYGFLSVSKNVPLFFTSTTSS